MTPHPALRGRRALLALALVAALGFLLWRGFEWLMQVDRYRPALEAILAERTGLPVSIGRLDLAWRPTPCLSAREVVVGTGDTEARASSVDFFPALERPADGRVVVRRIGIEGLRLALPPDAAAIRAELEGLWQRLTEPAGEEGEAGVGVELLVRNLATSGARIRFGADAVEALGLDLELAELDTANPTLRLDSRLAREGGPLAGRLRLQIDASKGPHAGRRFAFRGTASRDASGGPPAAFAGTLRLEPDGSAAPAEALRLEIVSDALELRAAAAWGGAARVEVERVSAGAAPLGALLAWAGGSASLELSAATRLEGRDLALHWLEGGGPRVVSGALEVSELGLRHAGHTLTESLLLRAAARDGVIEIEEIAGAPLRLSGSIAPDADWKRYALALRGSLQLELPWLRAFGLPETVRAAEGRVEIEELSATLPLAEGDAPVIRARLREGAIEIASEGFEDAISGLDLHSTVRDRSIVLEGRARSRSFGPLRLSSVLDPASGSARGSFGLDAGAALRDEALRTRLAPLLAGFARGGVRFRIEPRSGPAEGYRLSLSRSESPLLEAGIDLAGGGPSALGDLEASAELRGEDLAGLLPEAARAWGSGRVDLVYRAGSGELSLDADLAALGLESGRYVEKRPGEPLGLVWIGELGEELLLRALTLRSERGALRFGFAEGRLVAPELDIALEDWSFLLREPARASGRIHGSYDGRGPQARLELSGVGLRFAPELGLDAVDGGVDLDGHGFALRELRIRGTGTDAVLDAVAEEGRLQGRLHGGSLDLDFLEALLAELDVLRTQPEPDAEDPSPLGGAIDVELDHLGYGKAVARNARGRVTLDAGGYAVRALELDTYEGHVSGTVVVQQEGPARQLALDLSWKDVTGRFLDDFLFDPPRAIRGTFDGTLALTAPLDDARGLMAGASGRLEASGRDGSFGRLGLASQLVAVLRTSEALRFRLPTFRDDGLVFDQTRTRVAMKDGNAQIESFELLSPSYAITADGHLDYRKLESRVPIEVNAIRGLTGLVEYVPVAGDALKILNVRLTATGSPHDLKVTVASVTDQVLGAGRAGTGAVVKGMGDVLRLLRVPGRGTAPSEIPPTPEAAPPGEEPAGAAGAPPF